MMPLPLGICFVASGPVQWVWLMRESSPGRSDVLASFRLASNRVRPVQTRVSEGALDRAAYNGSECRHTVHEGCVA